MRMLARWLTAVTFAMLVATLAHAQAWPSRPVRLVVNLPPGGTIDLMARLLGPKLSDALGQPVVIENRVGAAGNVGMVSVAKSVPDGYTLLISSGSAICIGPHLYQMGIDVAKDLDPVAPTAGNSYFLVVPASLPVSSIAEFIAFARANPGKMNYSSAGSGSQLHIATEMLKRSAKFEATHVPFKGLGPALLALLAGQVDFMVDGGTAAPHIKAGKLRLLAAAGERRPADFPDVPTFAEVGMPEVDPDAMAGVYAPAGTPRDIIVRLNREIGRIMMQEESRVALARVAASPLTMSPEQFTALQQRTRDRFGVFIRENNIRPD